MSDLSKTFPQLLIEMINAKNAGANLKTTDITIGAVSTSSFDAQRNSEVVVTGKQEAGFTGTQTFYYNRLSLAVIGATGDLAFDEEGKTRLSHVVAEFNARFGTNLVAGVDYTDADLPAFTGAPGETHDVTLTALATSYVYINSVTLTVKAATRDLAEVVPNNLLDGLVYTAPGG